MRSAVSQTGTREPANPGLIAAPTLGNRAKSIAKVATGLGIMSAREADVAMKNHVSTISNRREG